MTGFIESGFDPRDFEYDIELKTEGLPTSFNYSKYTDIKVKDQGNSFTCVPHSICTVLEAQNFGKDIDYDIYDVYNRRPEPRGDGMMIRDALKILKKDSNNKFLKYFRLRNLLQIKWSIVANGPCIFALPVRSMNKEFWKGYENMGGHAITCVGYDDDGFILQNSWGRNWGDSGMTKLLYHDLNYIIEAWGIE